MWSQNQSWRVLVLIVFFGPVLSISASTGRPYRILMDTDVDTDDFFALLYILKLNRSEFDLKAVTISANAWSDAGHAVNHIYDILYMMGRDDITVGVGGEGGILPNGTILPDVGGYLPLIEQGLATSGYCRYRQAVPVGRQGRLDIDTNFGIRKAFLPQGKRSYVPLQQPTSQQVMVDTISKGPTTVFLLGSHTNFAIFLMRNPHLKKNVEHIYAMGGGIRSFNPDCCPEDSDDDSCDSQLCGDKGNIFTAHQSNPYAEYNIFADPFAAYQVIHSGIPVTLVPLDATNTIPITKKFLEQLELNQRTYEAQYCFESLKMARSIWYSDQFYQSYFMWDSFTVGVAISIMRNPGNPNGDNEFSVMRHVNLTIVTSNQPYGISDGSNPFFDDRKIPRFGLEKGGVHSGHVQMGLTDPFCFVENGKGKCQDGYTKETNAPEAVRVLVARSAKPDKNPNGQFETEFAKDFLDVINRPKHSGKFNITTQFSYHKLAINKPNFELKNLGKPVIFDMDMSAGDFLALFYLLKVPREVFNLEAIFITPTGWANAATIDVVYDLLHMMNRDDIPVGLGDFFAINQSYVGFDAGDCKYAKAIPLGSGGSLDSDTLYGLGRNLPKSPRRYTAENSKKFGAPRETDHPQLRQRQALEIWKMVTRMKRKGNKVTILTNGPLTTLASIIASDENAGSLIQVQFHSSSALSSCVFHFKHFEIFSCTSCQNVFVVGGHISCDDMDMGNVFTIPSNKYAEFNMFLDPLAAKRVFESEVNITLVPLGVQRKSSCFSMILEKLRETPKTPEVLFVQRLLNRLQRLQKQHFRYQHMDIFLGEILGALTLASGPSYRDQNFKVEPIRVVATGNESSDGQLIIDEKNGKPVKVLRRINQNVYYDLFAKRLGNRKQSAVLGSFSSQKKKWSTRHQ